ADYSGHGPDFVRWSGPNRRVAEVYKNEWDGSLDDLAAVSASNVWAVGHKVDHGSARHAIVAHWNGRSWSQLHTPSTASRTPASTPPRSSHRTASGRPATICSPATPARKHVPFGCVVHVASCGTDTERRRGKVEGRSRAVVSPHRREHSGTKPPRTVRPRC